MTKLLVKRRVMKETEKKKKKVELVYGLLFIMEIHLANLVIQLRSSPFTFCISLLSIIETKVRNGRLKTLIFTPKNTNRRCSNSFISFDLLWKRLKNISWCSQHFKLFILQLNHRFPFNYKYKMALWKMPLVRHWIWEPVIFAESFHLKCNEREEPSTFWFHFFLLITSSIEKQNF